MTFNNTSINCFVIMPFSETKHTNLDNENISIESSQWTYIYNYWIKKATESYSKIKINCKRSETIPGNFIKGIINDIYNSELAIVDLTGQKPNVYYELGIRHSLKLGTIIITQDFKALPSDLNSYYCVSYNYTEKSHLYDKLYKEFEEKLHFQIDSVLKNINEPDNPIADYLDLKHYYEIKNKDKQLRIIFKIIYNLQKLLVYVLSKFQVELRDKNKSIENSTIFFTFIDFDYFDNTISNLFNSEFEFLNMEDIDELREFYLDFRKDLYYIHQYWEGTRMNIGKNNITRLFDLMEKFLAEKNNIVFELKNISEKFEKELKNI